MKVVIVEYAKDIPLDSIVHKDGEIKELIHAISKADKRIADSLGIKRDTLQAIDGKIRAQGIAGIIQLTSSIEIEVIPKFLKYIADEEWKTTLYMLSTLSKYGSIITTERIGSSTSYVNSLYDIAGRILAREYLKCKRKPIRQYRDEQFRDYSIEGDIDFDTVFERNSDGIQQSVIRFDRNNIYNATIREAMKIVRTYVSDLQTKNILSAAICEFGGQGSPTRKRLRIPARNIEWRQAYDLSYDIICGLGNAYDPGKIIAPGFVVDTWKLWEWLITIGLRNNNNVNLKVLSQRKVQWGIKECAGQVYNVNVFPDLEISSMGKCPMPLYLVDAKYKILENSTTGEINREDLYEAFAFCNATGTTDIFLVYPEDEMQSTIPGNVRERSIYYINDIRVHVVQVSFGTITTKGGVFTFSRNLTKGINDILELV